MPDAAARMASAAHRIEGIGDKHVPWIHNVRNTDMVMAIDDEAPMQLIRLFNEPAGQDYLAQDGRAGGADRAAAVARHFGRRPTCCRPSRWRKWYEWGEGDVVLTVLTDSMELYESRLGELTAERGQYTTDDAASYHQHLMGATTDNDGGTELPGPQAGA